MSNTAKREADTIASESSKKAKPETPDSGAPSPAAHLPVTAAAPALPDDDCLRAAIREVTQGKYPEFPDVNGRLVVKPFFQKVIDQLGPQWETLTVDTYKFGSRVLPVWRSLKNEQYREELEAKERRQEEQGIKWGEMATDEEFEAFIASWKAKGGPENASKAPTAESAEEVSN